MQDSQFRKLLYGPYDSSIDQRRFCERLSTVHNAMTHRVDLREFLNDSLHYLMGQFSYVTYHRQFWHHTCYFFGVWSQGGEVQPASFQGMRGNTIFPRLLVSRGSWVPFIMATSSG